jgi:hypothetical protein
LKKSLKKSQAALSAESRAKEKRRFLIEQTPAERAAIGQPLLDHAEIALAGGDKCFSFHYTHLEPLAVTVHFIVSGHQRLSWAMAPSLRSLTYREAFGNV